MSHHARYMSGKGVIRVVRRQKKVSHWTILDRVWKDAGEIVQLCPPVWKLKAHLLLRLFLVAHGRHKTFLEKVSLYMWLNRKMCFHHFVGQLVCFWYRLVLSVSSCACISASYREWNDRSKQSPLLFGAIILFRYKRNVFIGLAITSWSSEY